MVKKSTGEIHYMTAVERVRYEIQQAREDYQTARADGFKDFASLAGRLAGHLDNLAFYAAFLSEPENRES